MQEELKVTLRDRFAIAALQGLTSTADEFWTGPLGMAGVAAQAYLWADAMLAARVKEK